MSDVSAKQDVELQSGIDESKGLPDHEIHRLAQLWLEDWQLTVIPYRGSASNPGRIRKSLANLLKIVIHADLSLREKSPTVREAPQPQRKKEETGESQEEL